MAFRPNNRRSRAVRAGPKLGASAAATMLFLLAGACAGDDAPVVPPEATQVPTQQVDTLIRESSSGEPDRRRIVLRTEQAWSDFWSRVYAPRTPPEPPSPDFDRRSVVAVAMGTRPTGGYTIDIESLSRRGGDVYVVVRETSPGESCITTQAITAPVLAVALPAIEGEAVFVERDSVLECSR